MELYVYNIASSSFVFLFAMVFLVTWLIFLIKGIENDLVDFIAFNMFPGILKSEQNDRNEIVVHLRQGEGQGEVLLQGHTLLKAKMALFCVCLAFIAGVVIGFGEFLFLEISHDCKNDQSHDCFEYPIHDVFHAVRANCSDPDILQGKTRVICYTLVFKFELAVGISYGMYIVCQQLLRLTLTLFLKMNQNNLKYFQLSVFLITFIICVTAGVFFYSHPFFRMNDKDPELKWILTVLSGFLTVNIYNYFMPWAEIIEERNR